MEQGNYWLRLSRVSMVLLRGKACVGRLQAKVITVNGFCALDLCRNTEYGASGPAEKFLAKNYKNHRQLAV